MTTNPLDWSNYPAEPVPEEPVTSLPPAPASLMPEGAREAMTAAGDNWSICHQSIGYPAEKKGIQFNSPCREHGNGNSECAYNVVELPAGAIVLEVRHFHLSRPAPIGDGEWHWNLPNSDLQYAMMDSAYQKRAPHATAVWGHARNWSNDLSMQVGMGVRWRPAK